MGGDCPFHPSFVDAPAQVPKNKKPVIYILYNMHSSVIYKFYEYNIIATFYFT